MATTTAVTPTTSTTDTTSYASSAFTPAASDLLIVFVEASDTVSTGKAALTDSQSLGFTLVGVAPKNTTADRVYMFVANTLAANSSMTVTFGCSDDAATGCIISILRIAGMERTGLAAIRQTQTVVNAAAATPAPAFAAACLTGNVTVGFVANLTNPAGITEPAGWTEASDVGYATPTQGAQTVFRDSGFTGTTVTWGGTTGTAYGLIMAELDTSALSGLYPDAISQATAAITTGTSLAITHVCSGSNRALYAFVGIIDNSTNRDLVSRTALDYNGTTMKYLGRIVDRGGSELFHYIYVLVAPASGSHTLTLTLTADASASSSIVDLMGISFAGANQTYPYKLIAPTPSGQNNSVSLALTVADYSAVDGDLIIGAGMGHVANLIPSGTQSLVVNHNGMNNGGAQGWGVALKRAEIGNTFGWTQNVSDVWSAMGVAVRPATATPAIPVLDTYPFTVSAAGATSATFTSYVIASSIVNGLLVVTVGYTTTGATNVTGIVWNSLALTLDASKGQRITDGSQIIVTEVWYRKLGASSSGATANIVATFSAAITSFVADAMVFAYVDQASTFGTVVATSSTSGVSSYSSGSVTSSVSAIVFMATWLWPDTNGYVYGNGSEFSYLTLGSGGTGVSHQTQAKIGAASVTIGGNVGASGGGLDYNLLAFGINFGAASAADTLWAQSML